MSHQITPSPHSKPIDKIGHDFLPGDVVRVKSSYDPFAIPFREGQPLEVVVEKVTDASVYVNISVGAEDIEDHITIPYSSDALELVHRQSESA